MRQHNFLQNFVATFNGPMISEEIGNYIVDVIHVCILGLFAKF